MTAPELDDAWFDKTAHTRTDGPAPNGLREAAEQIVLLLSKTESGNAFWWRKLDEARLSLEAALSALVGRGDVNA